MTLQNLLRIGRLKEHSPTAAEVQRLLEAIDRNLAECVAQATKLRALLREHLAAKHPELLKAP